ncbi:hypothetical protein [Cellvibrio sp. OA-2007]|uniref:hypothetical protein n=1 Tax=Cellvibrio sp. OA-2007 TaxID=529823 RepID=UPI000785A6C5|nr:hypothetical protein [Cellvibrio sp. OA-2007]
MINKRYFSLAALGAVLISGCANQTPITTDANSLEKAATHILSEAVYFSTLFSNCAALGGDTELDAIDIQQNWINANAKLVAAADSYYSQQQANRTFSYKGQTLAPEAIRLALDARARATNELALAQRSPVNKQKTCQFRLAQISGNRLPLTSDPLIAPYQAELLTHLPLDLNIADAPQLAGGISDINKGATYFTIAKAHEPSCTAAYTLTIANQWPNEAYANFCGANAVEILTCEWGKCETKKL